MKNADPLMMESILCYSWKIRRGVWFEVRSWEFSAAQNPGFCCVSREGGSWNSCILYLSVCASNALAPVLFLPSSSITSPSSSRSWFPIVVSYILNISSIFYSLTSASFPLLPVWLTHWFLATTTTLCARLVHTRRPPSIVEGRLYLSSPLWK